jgi:hypothetical protein
MPKKPRYGGGFDGRGGIGGRAGSFGQNDGSGTGEETGYVTPQDYPEEDPAEKHGANEAEPASAHRTTRKGEP